MLAYFRPFPHSQHPQVGVGFQRAQCVQAVPVQRQDLQLRPAHDRLRVQAGELVPVQLQVAHAARPGQVLVAEQRELVLAQVTEKIMIGCWQFEFMLIIVCFLHFED